MPLVPPFPLTGCRPMACVMHIAHKHNQQTRTTTQAHTGTYLQIRNEHLALKMHKVNKIIH